MAERIACAVETSFTMDVLGPKPNKVVEGITICRFSAVEESREDAA